MTTDPDHPAAVWGRDDLTCPATHRRVRRLLTHAYAHPWRGDTALDCPAHLLDTTAITEPGRPTRILLSLDTHYHQSGWFANSDYERCLHLSLSHPRPDVPRVYPAGLGNDPRPHLGMDLEAPTDTETYTWGRVIFQHLVTMTWLEPPASTLDPHRSPGVSHLRLYIDQQDRPIRPRGEVYHLRPFPDGTSPEKITEGRAGADVR